MDRARLGRAGGINATQGGVGAEEAVGSLLPYADDGNAAKGIGFFQKEIGGYRGELIVQSFLADMQVRKHRSYMDRARLGRAGGINATQGGVGAEEAVGSLLPYADKGRFLHTFLIWFV